MKNQKKAFTLTELLVVVIVIGVLSAAVLPKFSKIIETRKTTEAEELMASIRTEQEKRCALDKQYLTDLNEMTDIVKKKETKNYLLSLGETGVIASSKGSYSYHLKMPSYADGRICCDDCGNLNKNYPSCEALKSEPDYQPSPADCAGEVDEETVVPEILCDGKREETRSCGCRASGTQRRTCNTTTGTWGSWSACSADEACECDENNKLEERQACTASNTCGFETRRATCNTDTGEWSYSSWNKDACVAKPSRTSQTCNKCGKQTVSYTCTAGSWAEEVGECDKQESECEDCVPGRIVNVNHSVSEDTCDGDTVNRFNESSIHVDSKVVCYDVYAGSGGGGSSVGQMCSPREVPVCPVGQERNCIDGVWRCITPCGPGGCAGGTTNPIEDSLVDSGAQRIYVDEVTLCGPKLDFIHHDVIFEEGCSKVGQPCDNGRGKYVTDANNDCCCEPICDVANARDKECVRACVTSGAL